MRRISLAVGALIALSGAALADPETSVNSAYKICMIFDRTGLTSEPCSVSGWGSSVNVRIDMNAGEARKTCRQVSQIARENGWAFDDGWTLKIYSPYSGDNTIAYCPL